MSVTELLSERCVDTKEATEFSTLGRSRLYQLMASGELPYIKRGKRRMIPLAALKKFLADGLVGNVDQLNQAGAVPAVA